MSQKITAEIASYELDMFVRAVQCLDNDERITLLQLVQKKFAKAHNERFDDDPEPPFYAAVITLINASL